ncbi:arsenate reductase [Solemya velum gill symbiont]|uniref:ArsC family reductase n=1 Tax=Solemya velum gill symbiont TaxID=2340 RepID=UPI0009960667|nr:ArsC family reductase [Solemya velum gill symbiont]OOY38327.1 arsenate reductase [Solemya velum gill symbiont]OOY40756.1 arsenate reductase [Solemya velum gill symbiont]OOY42857.1 arsenate reductase [Solemya velum gill symbiont]
MTTTLYGIPNCDTMKKARKWLTDKDIDYSFHDFKKAGLKEQLLDSWLESVDWEILLNRRGMMWRKLEQEVKDNIDRDSARRVMLETPTIIKRPVLDLDGTIHVGFSEERYSELFG